MDNKALTRLVKEHTAAVQEYMESGYRVAVTLGKLSSEIDNQAEAEGSDCRTFTKCDDAIALVDKAFHAVRNALETG